MDLTPNPDAGSDFTSWSGDGSGSPVRSVTIDGNKSAEATFTLIEYTLDVTTAGTGSGTVTKAPDQATYHYGDTVDLTPNPDAGSDFTSWSGDGSGSPVRSVTIDGNKSAEATFTLIEYTLNITCSGGTGGGADRVTKSPDQATYHYGDIITLTAEPQDGETFGSWGGDLSGGANPDTILIDGDKNVTATFDYLEYTLTINTAGAFGTGTVTKAPDQPTYHYGDPVTLTAVPGTGEEFDQWSGDLSGTTNPDTITIDGDENVTANFKFIEYTLNITCTGGTGDATDRVTKTPDQATYHHGDTVILTAEPQAGEIFSSWGGDLSGSTNPDTLTIDGDKAVTASFEFIEYTLTITVIGTGTGSVTKTPDQPTYHWGDVVQLEAVPQTVPAPGSTFVEWSGDLSGSTNPDTLTIDGDKTVTAEFTRLFRITSSVFGGSGRISPTPYADVPEGSDITFTIDPNTCYEIFDVAVDGLSLDPVVTQYTFTNVTADHTIEATFIQYTCTITATAEYGGTISPSGPQTVNCGDSVAFTITPGAGNSVEDVLVNGVSVGAVTSYTFNNVKKEPPEDKPGNPCSHHIVAKFTRPPTSCLDISDIPLNTLARSAPANIMFVLDDSGSMDWEFMTNEDSGLFNPGGTAYRYVFNNPGDNVYSDSYILAGAYRMDYRAHWSGYNRMYYDPTADYQAWPTLTDADPNNPQSHPMVAGNTFNLRGIYETMGPAIVVDNQDGSPTFTTTGSWGESGSPPEYDGSSFYTGNSGDTATFTPNLPTAGTYEVHGWWNCYSDRDEHAEFTIVHDGGTDIIERNQR